jgi:hypothetical protein
LKIVASLLPNELLHSDSDGGPVRFQRVEHVIVQMPPVDRVIDREPPHRLPSPVRSIEAERDE